MSVSDALQFLGNDPRLRAMALLLTKSGNNQVPDQEYVPSGPGDRRAQLAGAHGHRYMLARNAAYGEPMQGGTPQLFGAGMGGGGPY